MAKIKRSKTDKVELVDIDNVVDGFKVERVTDLVGQLELFDDKLIGKYNFSVDSTSLTAETLLKGLTLTTYPTSSSSTSWGSGGNIQPSTTVPYGGAGGTWATGPTYPYGSPGVDIVKRIDSLEEKLNQVLLILVGKELNGEVE